MSVSNIFGYSYFIIGRNELNKLKTCNKDSFGNKTKYLDNKTFRTTQIIEFKAFRHF